MSQEIDIDEYRKLLGTSGNYTILFIPRINKSSELLDEVVGLYSTSEEILGRICKSISNFSDEEIELKDYKLENNKGSSVVKLSFTIVTSLSNEFLIIFRIYTRDSLELDEIMKSIDEYFYSLGLINLVS